MTFEQLHRQVGHSHGLALSIDRSIFGSSSQHGWGYYEGSQQSKVWFVTAYDIVDVCEH